MVGLRFTRPDHLYYIVGFIATDGNLSRDSRHITLVSKDRHILVDIKRTLKLHNKIGRKGRGPNPTNKIYSVLQIGNKNFYDFLISLGLSPNKSLTLKSLIIPQEYFDDFLRGVIDGDGNISTWIHPSNKNRQWRLRIYSAAPLFINWLKKEVERNFNVRGKLYVSKRFGHRHNLYQIKFGKLAAKIILDRCYYKDSLALRRKSKQVRRCLNDKNRLSRYGNVIPAEVVE